MDKDFAIEMYRLIREMQVRFARLDTRAMIEEESLCYQQHLSLATKHARLIEILIENKLSHLEPPKPEDET